METTKAVLEIAGLVLLAAKAITVWTPSRHDNQIVDILLQTANTLALNIGKDLNQDDLASPDGGNFPR